MDRKPDVARLGIFADSLYRLSVNGAIAGYGPARFHPDFPEADTYDLREFLRAGRNEIRVEVNSRGEDCYQAFPGRGGLVLWGEAGGTSLDLPDGWTVEKSPAWDPDSENFSFAQGPIEICDTRRLGAGDRVSPVEVEGREFPLSPAERGIPRPSNRMESPRRTAKCALLDGSNFRVGFRCPAPQEKRQPFFTHIFSPRAQTVRAGVFWGPVACGGKWLKHEKCGLRGNRETVDLELEEGWNFLFGVPEAIKPHWVWQMELPDGRGLRMRSRPDRGTEGAFCIGEPIGDWECPEAPLCPADVGGENWPEVGGNGRAPSPARELAWDEWGEDILSPGAECEWPLVFPAGAGASAILDFEGEYLGHPFIDIEGPEGGVLDIGYDERLKPDGMPGYYLCNPFVNSADRFVLAGGRQRIEVFHERGGRYLQLTARGGGITIYSAGVRSACGDYPSCGAFRCGDADLDWAWKAGERTLRSSMADGWIDPWRERGLYLGDALVQGHSTRKITTDWRLDPWCLRLWARSQFGDGQMPDVVPSTPHRPLCDYTLIWILALRNYWAASGDTSLVDELWPAIPRIFASPVWSPAIGGLWQVTPDCKIFVDWGCSDVEKAGTNACLNAFRFAALSGAAELAGATGRDSAFFLEECERVRRAFVKAFWDDSLGRFVGARMGDDVYRGTSLHANALACAFGLAEGGRLEESAAYLARGLVLGSDFPEGRIEVYFLYYALAGLYAAGRVADAEQAMRAYYGRMRRGGAWTLWERMREGSRGIDSLCHGWSSGAMPFLSERILGVRPTRPGDPSSMLVAPEAETLDSAEGVVPHPEGQISVKWKICGDDLRIDVVAPEGVSVEVQPRGRLGKIAREKVLSRGGIPD